MSVLVPKTPRLDGDARVDVCVVGGGIAGLTTAYLLAREGRSVLVLDDGEPGSGMTRMTTAHLANALDDRYAALERLRGGDAARLAAESHTAAITRIQSIARLENIDCGFRRLDGFLFSPAGDGAGLEQELQAARRAGVHGVDRLERAPLPSFDTGPCLVFPGQAQFHPLKYLAGLVAAIGRYGGRVCGGTHVDAVMPGKPARVQAGIHQITADAVVVATNIPIHHRLALHLKQAAYMTYVIAARVPRHAVPTALYWDTADPYHYVRLQPGEGLEDDLLIVGGEDHRTGQAHDADARQDRLEAWARERFPITGPVAFRWSGQVVETPDGLAYIGRDGSTEGNVYVATGDSGMGMTHGTIAGVLITDQIFGRANPWEDLYDPLRRPAGALAEFAPETMRSMAPLADWLTPGEGGRAVDLRPGEGAVLRRGLAKAAVYRDEEGTLHEFSAVCPHLGCLVRWNGFDKTFDCPCHGSRFDRCGHVINGPANEGLKAL